MAEAGAEFERAHDVWLASRFRVRAGSTEEAEAAASACQSAALTGPAGLKDGRVKVQVPAALLAEAAVLALGLLRLEQGGGVEGAEEVRRIKELLLRPLLVARPVGAVWAVGEVGADE